MSELLDFLNERVLPTRPIHHMQYPVEMNEPAVGVMIDCPEDALSIVVLPTFVRDVAHLELHFFVDGRRVDPTTIPGLENGCIELVLQRPNAASTL